MAQNIITIHFDLCEPEPVNGYLVKYRPLNSDEAFRTVTPNPTTSPVQIIDNNDPQGTSYEGTIRGDCGGDFGPSVPWEAINDQSGSGSESGDSGEPDVPCRTYILSATVGTPSAHYTDCFGVVRDTLITSMTAICTNGHGFTISGGGITVDSFVDGTCGDPFDYYLADEYDCADCMGEPSQVGILVRVPAGHEVQVGKFYRPVGHPTGFVYALDDTPQPAASSVELTEDNFNTCALACGG